MEALAIADRNRDRALEELLNFLRIPSISTQPEHKGDVITAAKWLVDRMAEAGLEKTGLMETGGHPVVYGEWMHAGPQAPTVLVYGHYDVQPADPLELWDSPPFEPTLHGDYLFARGASDDKGQLYVHVKAVEALLQANGALPVNIKFIFEGEEEMGSPSLPAFILQHEKMLAADVALISDTSMHSAQQPAIIYGLRGLLHGYLDITGPDRDLHSGGFGGGIDNPLHVLGHIIARLKDESGYVLIPGFYDRVRPLSSEEQALMAGGSFDEEAWAASTGAPGLWGEPHFSLRERLGARPTLDLNGISGGYTGDGSKTIIPSTVHAKVSMRLVPDQDPDEIAEMFSRYIRHIAPDTANVAVTILGGCPASITDLNIPAIGAASKALQDTFGLPPVFSRNGGSIPVVGDFQSHLGLESILMGFGIPDARIHSPNERFFLPNFFRGIEASIRFFNEYASSHDPSL